MTFDDWFISLCSWTWCKNFKLLFLVSSCWSEEYNVERIQKGCLIPQIQDTSSRLLTFSALNVSVKREDLCSGVPINLQYYRAKTPPWDEVLMSVISLIISYLNSTPWQKPITPPPHPTPPPTDSHLQNFHISTQMLCHVWHASQCLFRPVSLSNMSHILTPDSNHDYPLHYL